MILEYKLRTGAKKPVRANPSDAGLDVFYCPTDPSVSSASLKTGQNMLMPTGLSFGVPHGYMTEKFLLIFTILAQKLNLSLPEIK